MRILIATKIEGTAWRGGFLLSFSYGNRYTASSFISTASPIRFIGKARSHPTGYILIQNLFYLVDN